MNLGKGPSSIGRPYHNKMWQSAVNHETLVEEVVCVKVDLNY